MHNDVITAVITADPDLTQTTGSLQTFLLSLVSIACIFVTVVLLFKIRKQNLSGTSTGVAQAIIALIPLGIGVGIGAQALGTDIASLLFPWRN